MSKSYVEESFVDLTKTVHKSTHHAQETAVEVTAVSTAFYFPLLSSFILFLALFSNTVKALQTARARIEDGVRGASSISNAFLSPTDPTSTVDMRNMEWSFEKDTMVTFGASSL